MVFVGYSMLTAHSYIAIIKLFFNRYDIDLLFISLILKCNILHLVLNNFHLKNTQHFHKWTVSKHITNICLHNETFIMLFAFLLYRHYPIYFHLYVRSGTFGNEKCFKKCIRNLPTTIGASISVNTAFGLSGKGKLKCWEKITGNGMQSKKFFQSGNVLKCLCLTDPWSKVFWIKVTKEKE